MHVLRPLIDLGKQHAIGKVAVELGAEALEDLMRLGQVLVVGAFALDQIRHGIEPQAVDPELQPEAHHAQHRFENVRIVEIQIGLVRVEAMPVIGAGDRIPRPVRPLGIDKDDARAGIFLIGVATRHKNCAMSEPGLARRAR